MGLCTPLEYLERMRSLQKNVYMGGELVSRDDPRLMPGIKLIQKTYELTEELKDLAIAESHLLPGEKISRFAHIHQSPDDLLKKQELTREMCRQVGGCIQRCMGIDALNALSVVTKECDDALGTEYYPRFVEFMKYFQKNDLVGCCAQTDVKGDRSKRPHEQTDPDLYLRVVEKNSKGIVVRGCKAHNSNAPFSDEIVVVPTRLMSKKDKDWSVAFSIPADTKGIKQVIRMATPRPRKRLKAPANEFGVADSMTVFDDVLVPWDRVFLCGEHEFATRAALLFATYHRHSYTGCKPATTDIFIGSTALVADYNGVANASHIQDKLAELIAVAELCYSSGIAAGVKSTRASSGTYIPNIVYTNVSRYHSGINIYHEYETLADIAGGLPATLPPEEDFYNEETRGYLEKYIMRRDGVSAEDQHRCFRFLADLICSSHGAVAQVGGLHGGGSPIMEKIAIRSNYDLEEKKNLVKKLAGIKT